MADRLEMEQQIAAFVRRDFTPHFGEKGEAYGSHPRWAALKALGTELWLDTGSLDESGAMWTREFSALTTNNTLLNNEVQRGQYDALVGEACKLLAPYGLDERELILEVAFILNAVHGLRLVEEYDVMVSVEEHTDLANDAEAAVRYGLRYHAICPERFIVKIPLTPSGLLATRRLSDAGVPVNHTLGFSARQNVVIARIGKPAYVNVFLGRLNAVVSDNGLGDGNDVGEKATAVSQRWMRRLRKQGLSAARQIGASLRNGDQIRDLAGMDVMTMPPKAAKDFLSQKIEGPLVDRLDEEFKPELSEGAEAAGINTLWDVSDDLLDCLDALDQEDLAGFDADKLVAFFAANGCGDVLVPWTAEQIAMSVADGKIPKTKHWAALLSAGTVGLDAVMNLSGLNAFIGDQNAMDERVGGLIRKAMA
ncbi:MAG: transaldolase [Verrucomicrobia bacterium]|nr:transaldolase [Verrucomicrobiota bacterium]